MLQAYITAVKTALATASLIASFVIVEEWVQPDRGYLRFRAGLRNGDSLEASECFSIDAQRHTSTRYRYQWMNGQRIALRKRWDDVAHHPDLANFPHHIHLENGEILPGQSLSILELLELLESE